MTGTTVSIKRLPLCSCSCDSGHQDNSSVSLPIGDIKTWWVIIPHLCTPQNSDGGFRDPKYSALMPFSPKNAVCLASMLWLCCYNIYSLPGESTKMRNSDPFLTLQNCILVFWFNVNPGLNTFRQANCILCRSSSVSAFRFLPWQFYFDKWVIDISVSCWIPVCWVKWRLSCHSSLFFCSASRLLPW